MPFNTALSGLNAANADLKVTGNNIANASTVGFKSSRAEFGDVYATTILGSGSNTIGSGVRLQDVAQQFSQGNISFTQNSLDLAISGGGFFVLSDNGSQAFTRAGTFGMDKDGFIVNKTGANLQGFAADRNGNISGVLSDMRIDTGNQAPRQTTAVSTSVTVNSTAEVLQRSGTTFTTDGNAIGVAQVGQLNSTASTLASGSFTLPLLNNFSTDPITFNITLAGASANNGTVSVALNSANGMPPVVRNFNDLRTVAGVINGQIFSPNNPTQGPIDVVARAVDLGGGNYTLEFASLVPGESSQVSITGGNVATVAQTTAGTVSMGGTGASAVVFPPTVAPSTTGSAVIPDGSGIPASVDLTGATVSFAVDGGAPVVLDLTSLGAEDTSTIVANINAQIAATPGLNGEIVASLDPSNRIVFTTPDTGVAKTLTIAAYSSAANTALGLAAATSVLGSDGASFRLAVNGGVPQTVVLGDISIVPSVPANAATDAAARRAAIQTRVDAAVGAGVITVGLNSANQIYFEGVATGAANSVEISSIVGVDVLGLGAGGEFLGGDSAAAIGLPLGATIIADSSGRPAVTNGYPIQAIDITDPAGDVVTYTALANNSAAKTASELNALSGVSATASTTATISNFNNANGNSVIQLNGVSLNADTLELLETEINSYSTSTLPGISAVYDDISGTLQVVSAVGDDLKFIFSSTDDGDSIEIEGEAAAGSQVLEADPLGDGTATSTPVVTGSGAAVPALTGAENWSAQTSSFDISVDGTPITVSLTGLNPASLAAIQGRIDTALVANGFAASDVSAVLNAGQIHFESAGRGSSHTLRVTAVNNDLLGLTAGGVANTLYQGSDGINVTAEGVNGNINAISVGGSINLILDEGFTASNPTPPAIGLFGPFTATTFEPFIINEFDPTDQATYNHATSVGVFDSLGNPHQLTQYYVKQPYDPLDLTTSPNHWLMYVTIDGQDVGDPDTTLPPPLNTEATRASYNLRFNQDGTLNEFLSDPILISNWLPLDANGQPNGALGPQNVLQGGSLPVIDPPVSSNMSIDLTGSNQVSSAFAVNARDQNGYSTGRLSGIDIDATGTIFARFTNGEAQVLGQVALAKFPNDQGLQPVGDTMWVENFESGEPVIGAPGTAALGSIESGALEESNVDLSEQLVHLIIAQRNFQANAKTIETADQTTQTIINLR